MQEALFTTLARMDREAAHELATDLGGAMRFGSMEVVARNAASEAELQELLSGTEGTHPSVHRAVLEEWARRDPAAAAAWLEANPAARPDRTVFEVARMYLEKDPEAGVEWFMRQEIHAAHVPLRLQAVTAGLARQDVAAAAEWLSQQADDPYRDDAERSLSVHLARSGHWAEAFQWAAAIDDEKVRTRAAWTVLSHGQTAEHEPARATIFEAGRAAGFEEEAAVWLERMESR
ncbi:MAG: hypothetical protein HKO57_05165 [Akkermansiaceae bacterium]|nr:hypothetical protein [Akkermansiaceae bacterium]